MNEMPESPPKPDPFGTYNELNRTLRNLDERALVLTLAAFAEDTLGELLMAFFMPSAASRSLVNGFNAPLGNFSSRIKATYAIGLISKGQFNDLQHLREIRNKFSHTWKPISFTDPSVAGHILGLRFGRSYQAYPDTPYRKVLGTFQYLLIELRVAVADLTTSPKAKFIGTALSGGIVGDSFEEQLERATTDVTCDIAEHESSEGQKKLFYDGVLWVWKVRLDRLYKEAGPEREEKVHALMRSVWKQLGDRPDPNDDFPEA
ncbi:MULTISPECIES: MltR family transcriptional regulator [Pseudomonas syringae group]|uniref:Uncharacterized protein n=1 Tax=Pseudomonas syringae pv. castaneae TaxID=264450 RepID=A0A0P9SC64_PSESX|nr:MULTISPECIES: MltR family transcriptional regulator [Pseudomonas syringae group]KPW95552.1 Uncharacterized protein ALO79_03807 [Pseudomonas syringae pv. castaneae]KWS92077.1 hypothetical protein AL048_03020 [Pseudomonas syringae pv. castaneae]